MADVYENLWEMPVQQEMLVQQEMPVQQEIPHRQEMPDQPEVPDPQEMPYQQAFFSTPAGRKVEAARNGFPRRLTIACGAVNNVLLRDDDLYQTSSRRALVDFLNAIANGAEPTLENNGSRWITKQKSLFKNMVPMIPIVFNVVQCLFLIYPFEKIYETLLLEVFKESHAVYYIDMTGRKYTGMKQFEKHNKLFYGTMCYGERVAKVNLLRLVKYCLDSFACLIFVCLLIVGIYESAGIPNPHVGIVLGFLNIYMIIRNIQEYYDQKQFDGDDMSNEQFLNFFQTSVHLVTYTLCSIPLAFGVVSNHDPELLYVFLFNFILVPMWIYNHLVWYRKSFWSVPMVPLRDSFLR